MAIAPQRLGIGIRRFFTSEDRHPYDEVVWDRRDARISNFRDGSVAFEQLNVEVPASWSFNATNILAQKYFRGTLNTPERETSLKQVVDRIVDTITNWGFEGDYFVDEEEMETFRAELKHLLITQKAAFNSPVWFNIGVKDVPQQGSACFILAVQDSMRSILNWYTEEGIIFKGGSGAGVNLSKIRSSAEGLEGGGTASGPVSFMRGADASAGTIKSGGKTRRAAKMVILDVDHPDVEEFIWCKANEEKKARVLRDNGFDMDLDGKDINSIQYQNANNSVRVSDDFMEAVLADGDWNLTARHGGAVVKTVKARQIWREIAQAAWECADPGLQFDTTINRWHTSSNTDRINGSNPCSEYMHIDNSACNLASLNLMKFLRDDGRFDVESFKAAIEVVFTAQEIIVGAADYPTEKIGENSRKFRQLGLGYANIGALLMASGLAYDSEEGRAWAAAITALMTGHAYATSARTAGRMGPHEGFAENAEPMLNVLRMHRDAAYRVDATKAPADILQAAQRAWEEAVDLGSRHGVRNAQATVLAPTGTIGLLMDCDTTGIEPDLGLVKFKKLVGGGNMAIVNQTVPRALEKLGYSPSEIDVIIAYIDEHKTIVGAPALKAEHLPVFACSMGDNTIHYLGHVRMMGAVQPFISGAISKTVNMPEDATIDDVEQLHLDAWRLGVKAVAIYRDNCKVGQPLSTAKKDGEGQSAPVVTSHSDAEMSELYAKITKLESALEHAKSEGSHVLVGAVRERLPRRRVSTTFAFRVADCEGYVTVGEYEDGRPGEVFIKVSKQGSTLAGIMDAFSISISLGLQHGVPLATYVRKYVNMKFEPSGMTDDADLRIATSLVDYIFRRLALDYLSVSEREELGVLSTNERLQPTLPEVVEQATPTVGLSVQPTLIDVTERPVVASAPATIERPAQIDAPMCFQCGNSMQRAGSCYVCSSCGATSGCS
ncbi:MAG: vitamin B12-dependent ribonucleotide reductase [Acidobacteriota bacterium]|nr:vitamin B12-dependent ribonucleotide reductase [Acidobacteriota bacterium]MDE3107334.1 vitamin B12-dependent ribonucleotide reductase [Acidobacteriota bacterium]